MSIKLMNLIWSDYSGRLTGIEKSILLKMADYAADDGSSVYPSLNTLSNTTGFSKNCVVRTVKSLLEKRFLIKLRSGKAKHQTTLYQINVQVLENIEKETKKPKVIHKKSVYKMNCTLSGYSHCTLWWYSHCTLRGSPPLILTTIINHQLVAGANKSVDNSFITEKEVAKKHERDEAKRVMAIFLMDCQKSGIDIGNALDRLKEFVPDRIAA